MGEFQPVDSMEKKMSGGERSRDDQLRTAVAKYVKFSAACEQFPFLLFRPQKTGRRAVLPHVVLLFWLTDCSIPAIERVNFNYKGGA